MDMYTNGLATYNILWQPNTLKLIKPWGDGKLNDGN